MGGGSADRGTGGDLDGDRKVLAQVAERGLGRGKCRRCGRSRWFLGSGLGGDDSGKRFPGSRVLSVAAAALRGEDAPIPQAKVPFVSVSRPQRLTVVRGEMDAGETI